MPDQKEANSGLSFNNPFPFWLPMHQAVTLITEEANQPQSRTPPSYAALEKKATEKLTEHQTGCIFEGVKQALRDQRLPANTFDDMRSAFIDGDLSVSLAQHANNSLAGYIALCINVNETTMHSDFQKASESMNTFRSPTTSPAQEKKEAATLYSTVKGFSSRLFNRLPFGLKELCNIAAGDIAAMEAEKKHVATPAQSMESGSNPHLKPRVELATARVVQWLYQHLNEDELHKIKAIPALAFLTAPHNKQPGLTDAELKKLLIMSLVTNVFRFNRLAPEKIEVGRISREELPLFKAITEANNRYAELIVDDYNAFLDEAYALFSQVAKNTPTALSLPAFNIDLLALLPRSEKEGFLSYQTELLQGCEGITYPEIRNLKELTTNYLKDRSRAYQQSTTRYGGLALLSAVIAALGIALAQCADCIGPDELIGPKAFDFSHFFDGHSAVAQWCHGPAGITALAVMLAVGVFAGYQAWTDARTSRAFENLKDPAGHLDASRAN